MRATLIAIVVLTA